jgi:TRAP-type C4-dicarboxylate transport system permease small subunit
MNPSRYPVLAIYTFILWLLAIVLFGSGLCITGYLWLEKDTDILVAASPASMGLLLAVILIGASETIRVMVDIADNTHDTSETIIELLERLERKR